jgi:hypothetical protein
MTVESTSLVRQSTYLMVDPRSQGGHCAVCRHVNLPWQQGGLL